MQIDRMAKQWDDHLDDHPGLHYDIDWYQPASVGSMDLLPAPHDCPAEREAQATDRQAVAGG